MKQLGIYGAGGFGREVAWLTSEPRDFEAYELVAFIDDNASGEIRGTQILSSAEFSKRFPDGYLSIAIGTAKIRELIAARHTRFATLIAHSAQMSSTVRIGAGSIICANSVLTVGVEVGQHVHINLGCTIGHDVMIEDFATLSPGVHISGNVHIGRGVFIGTGATIINGTPSSPITIGNYAVIAAGACVIDNCRPHTLYAGVPSIAKKSL